MNSEIQQRINEFEGVIGIFASRLDGSHPIELRGDEQFVTASVFKIPVLVELYRQVDKGVVDPEQRLEYEERFRVNGTGVLQEMAAGARLTVRDLATLMIIISDNVATDMMIELVGLENVNALLGELGLNQTALRKNSKALLYDVVGMDPDNPEHTYEENRRRVKSLELDPDADGLSVRGSNVSTPREMAELLRRLAKGELLSVDSTAVALHILSRQNLREMIPAKLPPGTTVANKTGTLTLPTGSVRTDAGIVYGATDPYVLVCFSRDLPDVLRGVDQIATLSRAVYDYYASMN